MAQKANQPILRNRASQITDLIKEVRIKDIAAKNVEIHFRKKESSNQKIKVVTRNIKLFSIIIMRLNLALHFTLRSQNNSQYTCNGLFAYSKPMQVFVR